MNRRDSARPAVKPAAVVELERLARQLGQPDQGLLDAASETLHSTGDPVDLGVVPKFVEESAEVVVAAHSRWRELPTEQRALVRGCSLDLIGLTADQILRLDRTFGEYRQSEADVKGAGENLAMALERAEALAEQARSVIQTVAGVPQQAPSAETEDPVTAFTTAIKSLRDLARELLDRGSPGVRKRCALYSLDQAYVQTLETTLAELGELSRKASDAAAVARKKVQVERTLGCARPLVEQLVHAFEHASRLNKNIPLLRASVDAKPGRPGDPKRSTTMLQKTAIMSKATTVEGPRRVERLVIGGGQGDRFKR
ncbi:MAG: hypothetical protein ABJB12_04085 [Pseudomonadota bacterium]